MRPTTFAAPLMSCFISPMPAAGLMLMPPLSNVMPLPTKTSLLLAPSSAGTYDEVHEARLVRAAATDGVDQVHAALLESP